MLGFLRLRAWDARREAEKKKDSMQGFLFQCSLLDSLR
jgi:hypothetical protein